MTDSEICEQSFKEWASRKDVQYGINDAGHERHCCAMDGFYAGWSAAKRLAASETEKAMQSKNKELVSVIQTLHHLLHMCNSVFVPSNDKANRTIAEALRSSSKQIEVDR